MTFLHVIAGVSVATAFALAGGVIVRNRRSIARWAFAAGMVVLSAESMCIAMTDPGSSLSTSLFWQRLRLLFTASIPGIWFVFSLTYARGNALLFLKRWRLVIVAMIVLPLTLATVGQRQVISGGLRQIAETEWMLPLGAGGIVFQVFLLVGSILILTNLEKTLRTAAGSQRWKIKFTIMGVAVLFVVRAYLSSQAILFRGIHISLEVLTPAALLIAGLLFLRAVKRTQDFETTVYPSQTVLHNSLTLLLAGVYLLIVGIFARLVAFLGGDSAFPLKAFFVLISLVALGVLLQSDRVRLSIRRFVSRHFRRPFYDYQKIWTRFTDSTASKSDLDSFSRTTVRLVSDVFQVLTAYLWLVDDRNGRLSLLASTAAGPQVSAYPQIEAAQLARIEQRLLGKDEPAYLEEFDDDWAVKLVSFSPLQFPNRNAHLLAVPLRARERFVGLLLIGDRVDGGDFSYQEIDVLKTVACHVAAGLLNLQLSRRLLEARELEAFQTMAAFFVHDLKNTASTLNLTLRNLPIYWDNPEFRADVLRAVSRTREQLNGIIKRLSLLRQGLHIHAELGNLNRVAEIAAKAWGDHRDIVFTTSYKSIPPIPIDSEQLTKVVTNLLFNASESLPGPGSVFLGTKLDDRWAVLSVSDTGCGMSPEFIKTSLFRPFRTTKKRGLGIGMFQSKMIVEAHGGHLSVSSEVERGTTVDVYLPIIGGSTN